MVLTRYTIKFFLQTTKYFEEKGGYPIVCRLRVNRRKAEFHIDKWCELKNWDDKFQRTLKDEHINNYISYIRSSIDDAQYRLMRDDKEITAKVLRSAFRGDSDKIKLVEVFEKEIKKISKLPEEYSPATISMYKTTLQHLKLYLKHIGKSNIYVQSFEYKHVEGMDYFLKADLGVEINTSTKYLKKLNAFYNKAVKKELVDESPFEDYKFKHKKTHKTFLTIPDVEAIQELKEMPSHIKITRDIFVFAIYTGLRYSDVFNLDNSNIEKDEKGNDWIRIIMQKTDDYLRIPLLKPAKEIIKKYKKQSNETGKPLPKMVEQRYNLYLKEIAKLAGIDKNLSSHVARHTFATSIRIKYGIPIEVISKLLGHKKLATTMVYSQITDDEVLRYMKD